MHRHGAVSSGWYHHGGDLTGQELGTALDSLGWAGAELGRRIGVHRNTVSRWLTGKAPVPQYAAAFVSLAVEVRRLAAVIESRA